MNILILICAVQQKCTIFFNVFRSVDLFPKDIHFRRMTVLVIKKCILEEFQTQVIHTCTIFAVKVAQQFEKILQNYTNSGTELQTATFSHINVKIKKNFNLKDYIILKPMMLSQSFQNEIYLRIINKLILSISLDLHLPNRSKN